MKKKAKVMLLFIGLLAIASGALALKAKSDDFGTIIYEGPNGPTTTTFSATITVIDYSISVTGIITGYYTSVYSAAATVIVHIIHVQ